MISRRRFLGYSAIQAAVAMGLNSVSLQTLAANATNPNHLPKGAPKLVDGMRFPIILIGTGYGNAVTALRLAEKGHQVVMLEMGQIWANPGKDGKVFSPTLGADERSMWDRTETKPPVRSFAGISTSNKIKRHAGVLGLTEYSKAMQVYMGHGVGGGSLVNGGMAVTPPQETFGEILPQVNAKEMYDKYYPLANKTLGVNHVDKDWFETANCYQFARVSRASAQRTAKRNHEFTGKIMFVPSTYDLNYLKQEEAGTVPLSALNREVIYGNNAGRKGTLEGKRSLDKTYLADAVGTNKVTIYALQQVYHIEQKPDGDYLLKVRSLDEDLNTVADITISCGALFIGAGSCGTSELLVRARDKGTLPNLNAEVGQGWGNNGNIMSARAGSILYPTGLVQSTIPLLGINDWHNKKNPIFCEITPLPVGYVESWVSMYLAITKTPERSFFKYDSKTDKVTLQWEAKQADHGRNSIKTFLDMINEAEWTGYRVDLFNSDGDIGKKFGDNFTYHPLGGCVLGKATDNYGRVHGYSKLYVTDGSLIPGLVGVNPFVTITALAERNIDEVIKKDFS